MDNRMMRENGNLFEKIVGNGESAPFSSMEKMPGWFTEKCCCVLAICTDGYDISGYECVNCILIDEYTCYEFSNEFENKAFWVRYMWNYDPPYVQFGRNEGKQILFRDGFTIRDCVCDTGLISSQELRFLHEEVYDE